MKRILLGLFVVLGLIGCTGLKPAVRAGTPIPTNTSLQDDYAIYTTLLPVPTGSPVVYVIEQTTYTGPGDLIVPDGELPALSPETLADYNIQNRQSYPLNMTFTGEDPRYALADSSDFFEKPTTENGLRCHSRFECFNEAKFKAAYPEGSGIFFLSGIGYNADRTQALVAFEQYYGQDSGVIDVLLLVKEAGQWQIVNRYETHWII